jgi:hypothetical protein
LGAIHALDAFSELFSDLLNPRQSANISYPLFDILFLTVCAIIGGYEGWEESKISGWPTAAGSRIRGYVQIACPFTIPLPE